MSDCACFEEVLDSKVSLTRPFLFPSLTPPVSSSQATKVRGHAPLKRGLNVSRSVGSLAGCAVEAEEALSVAMFRLRAQLSWSFGALELHLLRSGVPTVDVSCSGQHSVHGPRMAGNSNVCMLNH